MPAPDEDHHGLAEAWEAHHFHTPSKIGEVHTDGDGTPEWLEQALGLSPANPNQSFRASLTPATP